MRFDLFSFGSIQIDGVTRDYDVMIDGGDIRKRRKKPSKQFRDEFGRTPLSIEEGIPWKCRRLVVGKEAYGRLPLMKEVKREAERRKVKLLILPTSKAIEIQKEDAEDINAPSRDVLTRVDRSLRQVELRESGGRAKHFLPEGTDGGVLEADTRRNAEKPSG